MKLPKSIRHLFIFLFFIGETVTNPVLAASDASLKLHYEFGPLVNGKVQDVTRNGYDASLMNNARVRQINSVGLLELGSANGYLDLGSKTGTLIASLTDFTISTFLFIDPTADINGNGNFVWAFSTQDACTATTGKYIAYRANAQRYEQSAGGWNNELVIVAQGSAAKKGQWSHVCYAQSGTTGTLYINGEAVKTGNAVINPSTIGTPTTFNCIGRPPFNGDNYLQKTTIADFRIYDRALNQSEIIQLMKGFGGIVSATTQKVFQAAITSNSPAVKKLNIVLDDAEKTIFLPVKPGTLLKAFDPKLASIPGVSVSPVGVQDFSKGFVHYTFQLNDTTVKYSVSVAVNRNPVLEGYYADPEILYSEKTGKFYLYPTSDGFLGWSGTYFKCFSSDNLETWKDEGVILQLGKDVTWASANAWAPCIVEKKINGEYRYFYYFCAKQQVGVAVSDNPTGPFIDSGKALINFKPAGQRGGQEIDPDVFTDPVSSKSYLYWGNGYMAGVELNDDMTSIKTETIKVLTPDRTFREATYVIFRNGTYYFMWSQDDTGSPNYKVRYATATSPLGPLTIPSDNIVIARDDKQAIYGTGHNSVLQIPGRDEWYIVYHRLTRPKGITLSSPGFYREVCIDKLEFNADGSIKRTKPTLEGVAPINFVNK